MADFSGRIDTLSPDERLKLAKKQREKKRHILDVELEERRKALEEELKKRKEELESLEKEAKKDLEEVSELEESTLQEIISEEEEKKREIKELEDHIREFRNSGNITTSTTSNPETTIKDEYDLQQSEVRAQQGIDYLLNATPGSESKLIEQERNLYNTVRQMASQPNINESYTFNKIQEQIQELRQRKDDHHGYLTRITNFLNVINDYK